MSAQTFANTTSSDAAILAALADLRTDLSSQHAETTQRFENLEGGLRELTATTTAIQKEINTLKAAPPLKAVAKSAPKKKVESPEIEIQVATLPSSPFRHPFPGVVCVGHCQAVAPAGGMYTQCWKLACANGFCNAHATEEGRPEGIIQDRIEQGDEWKSSAGKPIKKVVQYLQSVPAEKRPTQSEYEQLTKDYFAGFGIDYEIPRDEWIKPKPGRKSTGKTPVKKGPVGRPKQDTEVSSESSESPVPVKKVYEIPGQDMIDILIARRKEEAIPKFFDGKFGEGSAAKYLKLEDERIAKAEAKVKADKEAAEAELAELAEEEIQEEPEEEDDEELDGFIPRDEDEDDN